MTGCAGPHTCKQETPRSPQYRGLANHLSTECLLGVSLSLLPRPLHFRSLVIFGSRVTFISAAGKKSNHDESYSVSEKPQRSCLNLGRWYRNINIMTRVVHSRHGLYMCMSALAWPRTSDSVRGSRSMRGGWGGMRSQMRQSMGFSNPQGTFRFVNVKAVETPARRPLESRPHTLQRIQTVRSQSPVWASYCTVDRLDCICE